MATASEQVLALTGLTVDPTVMAGVLAVYGTTPDATTVDAWVVHYAAADLLTRAAITAAATPALRQVEDLSMDNPKPADLNGLAVSLRARGKALEDAAAGVVFDIVEFAPYGGWVAAVEAGDQV